MARIITLTTDFGLRDPYVAEIKAVILAICPEAAIVDVSHEVLRFDIRMGAYLLSSAVPYFPKGTVHLVVVDPGVGTARRCLAIETNSGFFVGPDNGVLVLAAQKQGIVSVREITNPKLMLPHVSNTFHGRDVFAPVAAHLANGVPIADVGAEAGGIVRPEFAKVEVAGSLLLGEVLHIDGFGNIVTNIGEETLTKAKFGKSISVQVKDRSLMMRFVRTYAEAQPRENVVLLGSQGYFEIAMNQGDAAKEFKAKLGDRVVFAVGK